MIPGQIIGKSQDYGKNADDPVCFANRAFIAKGMDIPCAYISKHFQTVDFTADPESGRQVWPQSNSQFPSFTPKESFVNPFSFIFLYSRSTSRHSILQ